MGFSSTLSGIGMGRGGQGQSDMIALRVILLFLPGTVTVAVTFLKSVSISGPGAASMFLLFPVPVISTDSTVMFTVRFGYSVSVHTNEVRLSNDFADATSRELFASSVALSMRIDSVLFRRIFLSAPVIDRNATEIIIAATIPSIMENPSEDLVGMYIAGGMFYSDCIT